MEEILNELITTLEEMNDEKSALSKLYKEFYTKDIKGRDLNSEDENFYLDLIRVVTATGSLIEIDDFKPNEAMLYLYNRKDFPDACIGWSQV